MYVLNPLICAYVTSKGQQHSIDVFIQLYQLQVTSVRYGGSPFNFQEDGLNIYENEWFQENEVYATASSPNFSPFKNAGSLIVTGRSAWTLYE